MYFLKVICFLGIVIAGLTDTVWGAVKPASNIAVSPQTVHFVALADIHFDPYISCGFSRSCPLITKLRQAPASQWANIFSEYQKKPSSYLQDTNYPLLASALAASKNAADTTQAQFVLVLGDTMGHEFRSRYKKYSGDKSVDGFQAFARKTLEFITAQLQSAFPNKSVYMVVGNNDSYQGDYVTRVDGTFFQDAAVLWSSLIRDSSARASMQKQFPHAGYYAVTLPGQSNLRLIVLNSDLFSYKAKGRDIRKNALIEFAWLHAQLKEAKQNQQKVFIATHIPEGIDIYATLRTRLFRLISLWNKEYIDRFQNEINEFAPLIAGIFAGHLHSDWFQIMTSSSGSEVPITGVPSISPIFGNNPAFKVYAYTTNPIKLDNYVTYYYPLNNDGKWVKEYHFKRVFAGR